MIMGTDSREARSASGCNASMGLEMMWVCGNGVLKTAQGRRSTSWQQCITRGAAINCICNIHYMLFTTKKIALYALGNEETGNWWEMKVVVWKYQGFAVYGLFCEGNVKEMERLEYPTPQPWTTPALEIEENWNILIWRCSILKCLQQCKIIFCSELWSYSKEYGLHLERHRRDDIAVRFVTTRAKWRRWTVILPPAAAPSMVDQTWADPLAENGNVSCVEPWSSTRNVYKHL